MADISMYDSDALSDDFMNDSESDFDFNDDDCENVAPPPRVKATAAKRGKAPAKKAAAAPKKSAPKKTTKKKASKPLAEIDDNVSTASSVSSNSSGKASSSAGSKKKGNKSVEQMYQKKTQLEHILLRPDTYIGSVEPLRQPMFILDSDTGRIVQREITYTPGLYKIYDEILVNAADNKQRDPDMNLMDIEIDAERNLISVKNNGNGIPVVMHKDHNCYVPTLIFGHLLTGSNFDDDEKKTTGGRNGYGAKLANIFSLEFTVECLDASSGKKFKQVFRNNMSKAEEPIIKSITSAEKKKGDYTKISFSPDLDRFKMDSLDEDVVALLSKRAYDIAGSMSNRAGKKLMVTLNGKKLPVKSFQTYLELYDGITPPSAYEKVGDRWEVGISASSDGSFQQISFVNAICTSKGGGHTTYIADQVAKKLQAAVKKKNKGGLEIKANAIKNHLCVFVNCLVENPAFDSQTKENLTTRPNAFGSECTLTDKFLKQVEKSGVIDSILAFAKFKQGQALKRQGGTKKSKLTGITKLDDANFAGTAKSKDCTLIITEGDSAKSLAMSGLSVVGRDYYGVFPLKGKPLNVREASHKQIVGNEEIKNLVEIMGIKFGTVYDAQNVKQLRYGHLMIMADQDHDGSHIKGLVINFIHHFWPSLLDVPDFLQQFITPIVKATKKKKSKTFFTLPEYEAWKKSTGNDGKGYTVKYYKGLGTSTAAEAKEYFSNLDLHEVHFRDLKNDSGTQDSASDDESDGEDEIMEFDNGSVSNNKVKLKQVTGDDLIKMAFSKKHVEDRKVWLNNVKKNTYLNYSKAQNVGVNYSEFINRELILFSQADNQRSIPHMMDGFKPSQRKVLFACFKRKLKQEIKVAQLAGYISEHSAYHHGEASLNGTIVGMAQNFCGSNNVNLLYPSGQFGTRRMGGKDAASPRYIFTKLEAITRKIFHPDDDALLSYLNDDGLSIEPEFYMPVIPLVLVNGSDGIGTGWSSSVPNYDPRAIIDNIRRLINGEEMQKLVPHFYGYTGLIQEETGKKEGTYSVKGKAERVDDTTVLITELPIKKWTQDYKVFLESLLAKDDKNKSAEPDIKDFKENHTDTTVSFTITAAKEKLDSFEKSKDGLHGKFKLGGSLSTNNMNLFDAQGRIMKYKSPEQILQAFFAMRLDYYSRRKDHLLQIMRREMRMLSNKARFVEEVCAGDLVVSNRKRADILADLKQRGYELFPKDDKEKVSDGDGSEEEDVDVNASDADLAKGYDYLLGMKIWSLTYEKAEQLRRELEEKTQAVADLEATTHSQIWEKDLDAIEDALDDRDAAMDAANKEERKAMTKNKKRQAKKKGPAKKKKGGKDDWNTSDEDSSGDEVAMDSDSDIEVVVPKKRAPAARKPRAQAANAPRKATTEKAKPKAKQMTAQPAPAAPLAPPIAPAPPSEDEEDDFLSDSDDELDLMARMKQKLHVSPAPVRRKPVAASEVIGNDSEDEGASKSSTSVRSSASLKSSSSGKSSISVNSKVSSKSSSSSRQTMKRQATIEETLDVEKLSTSESNAYERKIHSLSVDIGSEDESEVDNSSSSKSANGRKRPSPREAVVAVDTDGEEVESVASAPKRGQAKAKPSKKARAGSAKKPAPKRRTVVDLSDSEDDAFNNTIMDFDEDDESEEFVPPPPRARSARSRRQVNYALEDDSDSDGDSDFE